MFSDTYYVDRESGTYSDVCTAFGLAYILERVLTDAGAPSDITVKDAGTCYIIKLQTPLTAEILQSATYPDELLPFLQDEKHPEGARHYPISDYFDIMQSRSKEVAEEADGESAPLEVPITLGAYRIMRALQAHHLMNNLANHLWRATRNSLAYPELVKLLLLTFHQSPNQEAATLKKFDSWKKAFATKEFPTQVSLLTVVSPQWQQSVNRPKPDGPREEKEKGFWLFAWVKLIGLPRCALAISVRGGKQSKRYSEEDKKIYALSPSQITLSSHDQIMRTFQNAIYSEPSVKADVKVLLLYTKQFLGYVARGGRLPRFGSIRNVIDGFYCVYLKKSGANPSAYSLTALSTIQLPGWVSLSELPQPPEVQSWLDLIEEQEDVVLKPVRENGVYVDFLDETKGEGLELLQLYREWLSGGRLESLLKFHADFASLIMSQAAQKKSYRQFSVSSLKQLFRLMNNSTTPTLQEIISDTGFMEISRAIRLSTVTAQRLKSRGIKPGHEIRYGLAQELKRKAPFKTEFVAALMEFVNTYQTENARQRERGKKNIHEVTISHLQSVCALLDRCPVDAEPVASLLIAFGYAYDDTRRDDKGRDADENDAADAAEKLDETEPTETTALTS